MKKRNLSYLAYIIILLFPLLIVLCSHGLVSYSTVFASLPHITAFDALFDVFGVDNVWLDYMASYLTYILICSLAKTAYYAVTFLLDICDRSLRKEY